VFLESCIPQCPICEHGWLSLWLPASRAAFQWPCDLQSRQFRILVLANASRAIVGLHAQQTHDCDLCSRVSFPGMIPPTLKGAACKASLVANIFQLLLPSIALHYHRPRLGPASVARSDVAGRTASRAEGGWDGWGSRKCFTCTHCHVDID
jgi:hypothetical protein